MKPPILKGTRDFLPEDMLKRNSVMNTLKTLFERYGYSPIETPILNPAESILGNYGEEGDKLTYNFETRGNRRVALPYDLTVPFARFVASYWQSIPIPFKRYQIQRVWRAERPQKGRLREFYQCDIDVIGTRSLLVEAEVARLMADAFKAIGLEDIRIKVNSRRLINAVLLSYGIEKKGLNSIIRIIDKLEKIGEQEVTAELTKKGVGKAEGILSLLKPRKTNEETLKALASFDTKELEEFLTLAKAAGVEKDILQVDPSLARGLDYYTGIIFEVVEEKTGLGTLCAGGRYDNLLARFGGPDFSGMGVSFGFERIMLALEQKNEAVSTPLTKALVVYFDKKTVGDSLDLVNELRVAGINSEIYFEEEKLAKQFKYADKKRIPLVIIYGSDEKKNNTVTVKTMKTGKQERVARKNLTTYVSKNLN